MSPKEVDVFKDNEWYVESAYDDEGIYLFFSVTPLPIKSITEDEVNEVVLIKKGLWEDIMRDKSHLEGEEYQERLEVLDWHWVVTSANKHKVVVKIYPPQESKHTVTKKDVEDVVNVLTNIQKYDLHFKVKKLFDLS